jgi:hypothetical protein
MKLFNNAARRTLVPDPLNNRLILSPARTIRPPFSAFFQETTCPAWNDAHIAPLSLACIAGSAWLALARKQSRERFR